MRFYATHNTDKPVYWILIRMHTKIALSTAVFLTSLLPLTSHSFSVDEYRESLLNAYQEVFAGVCVADKVDFKAPDAELKPGAVAIEADQTELIDKKIIFTGNAELERDGMMVNADKLAYDKDSDSVSGQGDIRIQDPSGNVFKAQSMEIEVETLIGTADDVEYTLTSKLPGNKSDNTKDIRSHGVAKRID